MLDRKTVAEIVTVSRSLHAAGTMTPAALVTLAQYLNARSVQRTAETGVGASTFIFSRASSDHTVFASNADGSISAVKASPLLNQETTRFVEGPTQRTLPAFAFTGSLDAVLLDGPHGYPFPDLEYFNFYPQIREGGLLIIDDIQIRTIHNLFRFLCKDQMFRLLCIRNRTAFFERTAAPLFNPWADGWWLQEYNRRPIWRYAWLDAVKNAAPSRLRSAARRILDRIRARKSG